MAKKCFTVIHRPPKGRKTLVKTSERQERTSRQKKSWVGTKLTVRKRHLTKAERLITGDRFDSPFFSCLRNPVLTLGCRQKRAGVFSKIRRKRAVFSKKYFVFNSRSVNHRRSIRENFLRRCSGNRKQLSEATKSQDKYKQAGRRRYRTPLVVAMHLHSQSCS